MGSKMLIDAIHSEETRVVVARGTKIDEFDFESASRKPLKGNIYLAKVTRVEPSLQAAFVEYGGNRHGFLAFAEIHPDYYQIPIADRLALIKEQEEDDAAEAEEDADNGDHEDANNGDGPDDLDQPDDSPSDDSMAASSQDEPAITADAESETLADENGEVPTALGAGDIETVDQDAESQQVDSVGAEDALEEVPHRPRRQQRRRYKIQEVIKRRQILLVQVVKEERGNKGAALTTYLSLAGRYCVLMPNTARGGGISRKITDNNDRRRLKEVARDIEVPQGMGLIVRTAGAQRTRPEIKRDFDYLIRLWESVRTLTLSSQAPSLVYEEGSLIKRSIRDLYTKDVDEVIVEGEEAYREAKDFMKMLMPSHAKNVRLYKEARPLFAAHHIDNQLDALFSPTVTLPSGGYIVINQTEALVAIDINSGKSTREHSIEDTALRTNQEACEEIARQLRLRDLAGLVVVDFIDMDENRNNRSVERRMKDALKNDRARIQVGRISHFGLLEMSRQRLRPGLIEGTFRSCPHCEGRGLVRSVSSCGLGVLRSIEEQLQKRAESLNVKCAPEVASYLLNEKRDSLLSIEQSYGVTVFLVSSNEVRETQTQIERVPQRAHPPRKISSSPVQIDSVFEETPMAEDDVQVGDEPEIQMEDDESTNGDSSTQQEDSQSRDGKRRRRRGRRGRGNRADQQSDSPRSEDSESRVASQDAIVEADDLGETTDDHSVKRDLPEGGEDRNGGERRPRGRNKFGRNRGRRDNRDRNRDTRPERDVADTAAPVEFNDVPPQPTAPPVVVAVAIAEPVPRKWQPPESTVAPVAQERKAGWWSKRK